MKFIIMQFSARSVFLHFRSKYLPQHSVLKNLKERTWITSVWKQCSWKHTPKKDEIN
jgi:hypothetical protein